VPCHTQVAGVNWIGPLRVRGLGDFSREARVQTFSTLRAAALELFAKLEVIARARGAGEAAHRLYAARRRLEAGQLSVVVCGEFKRGKSSLLNALLAEPGLFPVDTYYATSVITTASYAAQERITVALDDGAGGTTARQITRDEIALFATESGNPDNAKKARMITIELPNQRLAAGLTFIDTPGIGGVYEEHSAATLSILPSADLLLFVTDTTQPLTESELGFVAEASKIAHVTDDANGQVFVLTKTDLLDDAGELLTGAEAKLAAATGRPAGGVRVIPVSAAAQLEYLASGDEDYLDASNFAELERVLWATIARRRAKALLAGALGDLNAVVRSLLAPIEAEAAALIAGAGSGLPDSVEQAQRRAASLTALSSVQAGWHAELATALGAASHELSKHGSKELAEMWERCRGVYLQKDSYLADPDKLVDRIAFETAELTETLSVRAERKAARVLRDLAREYDLAVEPPAVGQLPDPPVPALDLGGDLASDPPPTNRLRALRQAAGSAGQGWSSIGSVVGMSIGGIVGVFAGPGIVATIGVGFGIGRLVGIALGGTFGMLTAYKDAVNEVGNGDQVPRSELIWAGLRPMRIAQDEHVASTLDDLMEAFGAAAVAEVDNRIAQELESANDTLSRLQAARTVSELAARQRRDELATERAPLDEIRFEVNDLTMAAAQLGDRQ
jgi:Dynamin family